MSNDDGQGVEISAYRGPNDGSHLLRDGVDGIVEVKQESASIYADSSPATAVAINRAWLIVVMIIAAVSTALAILVKLLFVLEHSCFDCFYGPPIHEGYLTTIILLHSLGLLLYGYTWRKSRGPSSGCLNASAAAGFILNSVLLAVSSLK